MQGGNMNDLLQTGGAGGIGAILGAVLTFLGFKSRLETLEKNVVFEKTCKATTKGITDALHTQTELMAEMRVDIKTILKNDK